MNASIDPKKFYVFYDGDCQFCDYWVQWILKNDKKDQFLFASLQGKFGQRFLADRRLERKQFNTLYLWKPEKYYLVKSKAVLKIAEILGGKYALLAHLKIFPSFFSDVVYDKIAANRKKLMKDHCEIPTAKQRKKFVD